MRAVLAAALVFAASLTSAVTVHAQTRDMNSLVSLLDQDKVTFGLSVNSRPPRAGGHLAARRTERESDPVVAHRKQAWRRQRAGDRAAAQSEEHRCCLVCRQRDRWRYARLSWRRPASRGESHRYHPCGREGIRPSGCHGEHHQCQATSRAGGASVHWRRDTRPQEGGGPVRPAPHHVFFSGGTGRPATWRLTEPSCVRVVK